MVTMCQRVQAKVGKMLQMKLMALTVNKTEHEGEKQALFLGLC